MTHAIRIHAQGGPEVMRWDDLPTPDPGPGEVLIRQTAVGLNYIDVYFRSGLYKVPTLPAVLGMEAAGVVRAVGSDVTDIAVGDRVAYGSGPLGAYTTDRVVSAGILVPLPPGIGDQTAAAMMLQGMTAQYLLRQTYDVKEGDTIVVHAAAGGVGLIMCQWAKHLGATVIGVVSSDAKADLARAHGAAHVVVGHADLPATVRRITGGAMVPVVYDSVGRDTFGVSLDSLKSRGLMVSFGNSSGPVPPLDIATLNAKGSLFLTRPSLGAYTATRADLMRAAADLFAVVQAGAVQIRVNQTFALKDAATAHRALEARETTGSTVLLP
ncbi:MAG: quinone oxidoreductase [Gemmatimonadaceae bacterium]|nr:quinone oxidoreductase [Acetobacteraceae bacterium]